VFQALRGVSKVEQGYIKSLAPHDSYSEAVVVTFEPKDIPLDVLVNVHLRTHSSMSVHKMRGKYRSSVYAFSETQADIVRANIKKLQREFKRPIITMTLPFDGFKPSSEQFQDYYRTNMGRPFCRTYIDPKLSEIRQQFGNYYEHAAS